MQIFIRNFWQWSELVPDRPVIRQVIWTRRTPVGRQPPSCYFFWMLIVYFLFPASWRLHQQTLLTGCMHRQLGCYEWCCLYCRTKFQIPLLQQRTGGFRKSLLHPFTQDLYVDCITGRYTGHWLSYTLAIVWEYGMRILVFTTGNVWNHLWFSLLGLKLSKSSLLFCT